MDDVEEGAVVSIYIQNLEHAVVFHYLIQGVGIAKMSTS